jgi:hypothetical protein
VTQSDRSIDYVGVNGASTKEIKFYTTQNNWPRPTYFANELPVLSNLLRFISHIYCIPRVQINLTQLSLSMEYVN